MGGGTMGRPPKLCLATLRPLPSANHYRPRYSSNPSMSHWVHPFRRSSEGFTPPRKTCPEKVRLHANTCRPLHGTQLYSYFGSQVQASHLPIVPSHPPFHYSLCLFLSNVVVLFLDPILSGLRPTRLALEFLPTLPLGWGIHHHLPSA